jgi:iron complex transport system substrate-binding protein
VGLPVLTRARIKATATSSSASREIDAAVHDLLNGALAVYEIETDLLERLRPDVIVTQDLCDVCAVSFEDVCAAVNRLERKDVAIVNLHPARLADIWEDIRRVAERLGRVAEGDALLAGLLRRVEEVRDRAARAQERPRVLMVEWMDPVMLGGLWTAELVGVAAGRALVSAPGMKAPTVRRSDLEKLSPDVIVVKPCGFTLSRVVEEMETLVNTLPWSSWEAVAKGRVYLVDGNSYFNRPGPRIVDSLEILAGCLHPQLFEDHRRNYREAAVRVDRARRLYRFDA